MSEVIVYSAVNCPYCVNAKKLLSSLDIAYQEIDVSGNDALREKMIQLTGRRSVPQIIIDGNPIGGFDDLSALHKAGKLQMMIEQH